MKQKDVMLLVVVGIIAAVVSYLFANIFVSPPSKHPQKVEVVEKISSDFKKPDTKYFNSNSVNPTKLIQIGDSSNASPFQ